MFDTVALLLSSRTLARALARQIEASLGLRTEIFAELKDARSALEQAPERFLAAITHPTFNTRHNSATDAILRSSVPCVVLTSAFSADVRDELFSQGVADYVVKDRSLMDNVVRLLGRMREGRGKTILIVDDSYVARQMAAAYLQRLGFRVLEAAFGGRALELLEAEPSIRLVLTDNEMPGMSGVELVTRIRERWSWEELCVIGLSSSGRRSTLTAEFLKRGANDFLSKPFQPEELSYRVFHNLELAGYLHQVRAAQQAAERLATTDALTGAFNRRAFFERGEAMLARGEPLSAVLLDIDHFKSVNDTYGHAAGDDVLIGTVSVCQAVLGEVGLFGRLGGEEFGMLLPGSDDEAARLLERVRVAIAANGVETDGQVLRVTASLGISRVGPGEGLDAALQRADAALYQAKKSGRNRVIAWKQEHAA